MSAQVWLNLWASAYSALPHMVLAGGSSFHMAKFNFLKECVSSKARVASLLHWVEAQLSLFGVHFHFLLAVSHFPLVPRRPCDGLGIPSRVGPSCTQIAQW